VTSCIVAGLHLSVTHYPSPYSLSKSVQHLSSPPPLAPWPLVRARTLERRNHTRAPPPSSVSVATSSNLITFAISHPSPQPCRVAGPFPSHHRPPRRLAVDEPPPPNREPQPPHRCTIWVSSRPHLLARCTARSIRVPEPPDLGQLSHR
jgi:hypothetical protein